ncbi:MAG: hypothetical protein SFZ23_02010 [Planctomycetota bacterium]|nr:hypothetical protein [Planctomycetota bacterium]
MPRLLAGADGILAPAIPLARGQLAPGLIALGVVLGASPGGLARAFVQTSDTAPPASAPRSPATEAPGKAAGQAPGATTLDHADFLSRITRLAKPSPASAMAAFRVVQGAVRRFDDSVAMAEQLADLPRVPASVTLRLEGEVIGRGMAFDLDGSSVIAATKRAIRASRDRLRGVVDPAQVGASLAIGLELAGDFLPIRPETYAWADTNLHPGLDGVAMTLADGSMNAVFPGTALAGELNPEAMLGILIASATGDPAQGLASNPQAQPQAVAEKTGASLFRFRVVHLRQSEPSDSPLFLHRGNRLVREGDVTTASIERWCGDMAGHLRRRLRPLAERAPADVGGQRADAAAFTQSIEPQELFGIGLALLALHRHDGVSEMREQDLLAEIIARTVDDAGLRDALGSDPAAAATWAILLTEPGSPGAGDNEREADEIARRSAFLEQASRVLRAGLSAENDFLDDMPAPARSIATLALVRLAGEDEAARARSAEVMRSLYRSTPPARLVSQMPWLGWAELESARDGMLEGGPALRQMREQVWRFQLTADDAGAENVDLVGGIVFPGSKTPLPTAVSARPLAFLATIARDERLTPSGESLGELSRLTRAMRFLRQLTVDSFAASGRADSVSALGGVRMATWGREQPTEATAMTLLAGVEMIKSVRSMEARGAR